MAAGLESLFSGFQSGILEGLLKGKGPSQGKKAPAESSTPAASSDDERLEPNMKNILAQLMSILGNPASGIGVLSSLGSTQALPQLQQNVPPPSLTVPSALSNYQPGALARGRRFY